MSIADKHFFILGVLNFILSFLIFLNLQPIIVLNIKKTKLKKEFKKIQRRFEKGEIKEYDMTDLNKIVIGLMDCDERKFIKENLSNSMFFNALVNMSIYVYDEMQRLKIEEESSET